MCRRWSRNKVGHHWKWVYWKCVHCSGGRSWRQWWRSIQDVAGNYKVMKGLLEACRHRDRCSSEINSTLKTFPSPVSTDGLACLKNEDTSSVSYHRITFGTCQRFSSQDHSNRLIIQRDTASHTQQQIMQVRAAIQAVLMHFSKQFNITTQINWLPMF